MESRIQSYLRFAASQGRETQQIGCFLATFTLHDANPYINYAIPDDGAVPTHAEIDALVAAFKERQRKPRLEYLTPIAPDVEAALLAAGFEVETRTPLMICTPGQQRLHLPPNIELIRATTDEELKAMSRAQGEAWGGDCSDPSPENIASTRDFIQAGAIAILARDMATGEPAGGGMCTVPGNQTTEVAGIGVRPAFRRRGIAQAITAQLAHEAFHSGVTLAFLMAAGGDEARIYERAGFAIVGDVLHISRPEQPE
jgi:ribosomal protein S18 acetylase RimI-like enzyme